MLGEALGLVGGGEDDLEEEGDVGLHDGMNAGNEQEENQLQNMMYNLMV